MSVSYACDSCGCRHTVPGRKNIRPQGWASVRISFTERDPQSFHACPDCAHRIRALLGQS